MHANYERKATLKNLASVRNLLLFWLSVVASGTFFERQFKLTRHNATRS